jgi:hypothetical protein
MEGRAISSRRVNSLNQDAVANAKVNIGAILMDRLDHVRFYCLYNVSGDGTPTVFSSTNERSGFFPQIGRAAVHFAHCCDELAGSTLRGPALERAIICDHSRIYVFVYGVTALVLVADDGIGDACYHCRWDPEERFGITAHLVKAGLADLSQESPVSEAHLSAGDSVPLIPQDQTHNGEAILTELSRFATAVGRDVRACACFAGSAVETGHAFRNNANATGALRRDLRAIANCRTAAHILKSEIDHLGENLGGEREIIVSREMAHWEVQLDRQTAGNVVIELDPDHHNWLALVTQERLGRAIFSARRHCGFAPDQSSEDIGRPCLTDICNLWWNKVSPVRHRYCAGLFNWREKLWIKASPEPDGCSSAELPDVAGGLLLHCAMLFAGDATAIEMPEGGASVMLELLSEANEGAVGRKITILAPLRGDLYVLVSADGVVDHICSSVEIAARDARSPWTAGSVKSAASVNNTIADETVLQLTAEAQPLIPPDRFYPIDGAPIREQMASYAAQMGELAHRFEILSYVLAKRFVSWRAKCTVGGIRCDFSSKIDASVGRRIFLEGHIPNSGSVAVGAPSQKGARHWNLEEFIKREIVRYGTNQAKVLKILLESLGEFVSADKLSTAIGNPPAHSDACVEHQFAVLMSSVKSKVNKIVESNIRIVSPGKGHYMATLRKSAS